MRKMVTVSWKKWSVSVDNPSEQTGPASSRKFQHKPQERRSAWGLHTHPHGADVVADDIAEGPRGGQRAPPPGADKGEEEPTEMPDVAGGPSGTPGATGVGKE